ncbi:hypothetical protein GF324_06405 [bacterium]|nr:hypothetical protein [bacterium]
MVESLAPALEREAREKERDELERLKTVNQMAATIAHEFNNSLAIIKGSVDLIKNGYVKPVRFRSYSEKVYLQADRMKGLVNRMLNLETLEGIDYAQGLKIYNLQAVSSKDVKPKLDQTTAHDTSPFSAAIHPPPAE